MAHNHVYYIHGYLSGPDGTKAQLLQSHLNVHPITYRSVPAEQLIISECIQEISNTIHKDPAPKLIGSSLGGLLAVKTAVKEKVDTCILLNPAIIPRSVDISTIQDMPQRILLDMKDETLFTNLIDSKIILLLGTQDEVVPNEWGITFAKAQEAEIHFYHDDHRFSKHMQHLPAIIEKFL
jgi:predicted esterase YcpF (UPF0227 family)